MEQPFSNASVWREKNLNYILFSKFETHLKIMLNIYLASIHSRSCMFALFRWMTNVNSEFISFPLFIVWIVLQWYSTKKRMKTPSSEHAFSIKLFSFTKKNQYEMRMIIVKLALVKRDEDILVLNISMNSFKWRRNATKTFIASMIPTYSICELKKNFIKWIEYVRTLVALTWAHNFSISHLCACFYVSVSLCLIFHFLVPCTFVVVRFHKWWCIRFKCLWEFN